MKRGLIASTLVPMLVFVVYVTAFNSTTEPLNIDKYSIEGLDLSYNAPIKVEQTKEEETLDVPSLGKTFVGFKEALAFKESRGNYFTVNTLGDLGKYQFGKNTLKLIGISASAARKVQPAPRGNRARRRAVCEKSRGNRSRN